MPDLFIRLYESRDYESVKNIVLSAFQNTAYHTDSVFTKEEADKFLWVKWAKPALTADKPKCFVALYNNQVAGFLIYGLFPSFRKQLGFSVGNIVLLGTAEEFQNSALKIA